MPLLLVLKLSLVPALIACITLAGRRWGPAVAGWLSAFPVVAAPILFFIAIEHGPAFAATAAAATLSAVLAILVFALGYAWAASRWSWQRSLAAGFAAYAMAVLFLKWWAPGMPVTAVAVLAALLLAPRLFPLLPADATASAIRPSDLHLRMIAAAMLVLFVTHFSSQLGPQMSGILAMFPVMSSVLTVFSHRNAGPGFAVKLLRGTVLGYFAFATFCIVVSLALGAMAMAPAFLCALTCALLAQLVSRRFM
jgi:hypothetical protein